MSVDGISDITTTEGNLRNYSRICKFFDKNEHIKNVLIDKIKNNEYINRTNNKVIERHISILEHLNILNKNIDAYSLGYNGKIIYNIVRNLDLTSNELNFLERIYYYIIFFTEKTYLQLLLFLSNLYIMEDKTPFNTILSYYDSIISNNIKIWNNESLKRRLFLANRDGVLKRAEINRFNCMKSWLVSMGVLKGYELTLEAKKVLLYLDLQNDNITNDENIKRKINEDIYYLLSFIINKQNYAKKYNYNDIHRKKFIKYLYETYELYGNKQMNTLNSIYVYKWLGLKLLLNDNIVLYKTQINEIINKLYYDNYIEAIIPSDFKEERLLKLAIDKL